ncbi:MAG: hypothetical protein WKF66_14865 [Pedobacter sp.]
MKSQLNNYEQEKKNSTEHQTVIVENNLTGETDELDPLFEKDIDSSGNGTESQSESA